MRDSALVFWETAAIVFPSDPVFSPDSIFSELLIGSEVLPECGMVQMHSNASEMFSKDDWSSSARPLAGETVLVIAYLMQDQCPHKRFS